MSGRRTTGVDRAVLTVLGVLLLAAGGLVVGVGTGWTDGWLDAAPDALETGGAVTATEASWWPAACAGAAVVLLVLGVVWLVAHLPGGRLPALALPGSRTGQRLRVVPEAVARGAEERLAADPRVQGARLAVRRDRGGLVLAGAVRVDARVDLPEVVALVGRVREEAATVLGTGLAGDVRLQVTRRRTRRTPA